MVIETDQDRAGFFNGEDFAIPALIGNVVIYGLFDSAYIDIHEVDTTSPAFTARTIDLQNVNYGDTLTIESVDYAIRSIQNDVFGVTLLILSKK